MLNAPMGAAVEGFYRTGGMSAPALCDTRGMTTRAEARAALAPGVSR
jgi:hypothetical protein